MKKFGPRVPAERATRADRIAVIVITIIAVVWVGGVWLTSEARHSHLSPAHGEPEADNRLAVVPASLHQAWTHPVSGPAPTAPLVSGSTVVTTSDTRVEGLDPATGSTRWSYSRDRNLCGIAASFSQVIPVFKGPGGCGEVHSLKGDTGRYSYSRSSANTSPIAMVRSNDHVGVVTPSRMELWRDDLVRTVEFGDVDNPAEPGLQPFTGCTIRSALTRSNMLGVVENCPHDKKSGNHAMLRLMKAVPQDSRKPEIIQSYNLGSETAHIVAIGEDKAAVYVDATTPRIDVVDTKGHVTSSRDVTPSPLINEDAHVNTASEHHVFEPAVSDGPHHMFWWDGARLYAFDPESLSVDFVVADSLGTGDVIGDHHLLAPTNGAVSVIDTRTGRVEKTMPVDRQGGSPAPVGLRIAGTTVVERRGDALIGYRAEQAP